MGDYLSESLGLGLADQLPVPVVEKGLLTSETKEKYDDCHESATGNIRMDEQMELPRQPGCVTNDELVSAVNTRDIIIQGQDQILSDIKDSVHTHDQKSSITESEYHEAKIMAESNQDKEIHCLQRQDKHSNALCGKSAEEHSMKTEDQEQINRTLSGSKDDRETEVELLEKKFKKEAEEQISDTNAKVENEVKLLVSTKKQWCSEKILLETENFKKIDTGQRHRDSDSKQGELVLFDSVYQSEADTTGLSRNAHDHGIHDKDLNTRCKNANETVKETAKDTETESTDRYHHPMPNNEAVETSCAEIVSAESVSQIRDENFLFTEHGDTGKEKDSFLTELENHFIGDLQENCKADFDSIHEGDSRNSVKADDDKLKVTKVLHAELVQLNDLRVSELANTLKSDDMVMQSVANQTEGALKIETKQRDVNKTLLTIPSHVIEKDSVTLSSVDTESNVAFSETVNDVEQDRGSYGDIRIYTQTEEESIIETGKCKDRNENDEKFVGNKNDSKCSIALHLSEHAKGSDGKLIEIQYDTQYDNPSNGEGMECSTDSTQIVNSKIIDPASLASNSECHTEAECPESENCEGDHKETDSNNDKNCNILTADDKVHLKDLYDNKLADTMNRNILESGNAPKYDEKQMEIQTENFKLKLYQESKGEKGNVELSGKHMCKRDGSDFEFRLELGQNPQAACIDSQVKSQDSTEQTTEKKIPCVVDLPEDENIEEKGSIAAHVKYREMYKNLLYKEKHKQLTPTNKHVQALLKRSLLRKKCKPYKQVCPQQMIPNTVNVCFDMSKSDAYKAHDNKQKLVAQANQLDHVVHTSDKDVMKLEYAAKASINPKREIDSQALNRMKEAMKSLAESKKFRNATEVELRKTETKTKDAANAFAAASTLKQAISRETLISKPATPEPYKGLVDEKVSSFFPERKRLFPKLYQHLVEESVPQSSKDEVSVDTVFKLTRARQHIAVFKEKANAKNILPVSKMPDRILRKVKANKTWSPSENLPDVEPAPQQNVHVTGNPKNVYIINVNNSCPENNIHPTTNGLEINSDTEPQCKNSEKVISGTVKSPVIDSKSPRTEVPSVSTISSQNKHSTSCTENQRRISTTVNFDSCITIHDSDSEEDVRESDVVHSKPETVVGRPHKDKLKSNKNIHERNTRILRKDEQMSGVTVNKSRLVCHENKRDGNTERKRAVPEAGNSVSKCARERLLVKMPSLLRKRSVSSVESTQLKGQTKKIKTKGLIDNKTFSPVRVAKQAVPVDRPETKRGKQSDTDVGTNRKGPKHKSVHGSNTGLKRPLNALQIDIKGNQSKENMMEFVADKLRAIEKANDKPLSKSKPNSSLKIQVKGPEAEIIELSSDESDCDDVSVIESCKSSDESKSEEEDAGVETIIERCESSEESESEQDNNDAYEELDDTGLYDDDYYDYEKEEVRRKRGKKCTAASSCYVVLTKLTCIKHQNERVNINDLDNYGYCSTKCRKLFLKKYVNCTY